MRFMKLFQRALMAAVTAFLATVLKGFPDSFSAGEPL